MAVEKEAEKVFKKQKAALDANNAKAEQRYTQILARVNALPLDGTMQIEEPLDIPQPTLAKLRAENFAVDRQGSSYVISWGHLTK